jgi:acetyl esterase/lipase
MPRLLPLVLALILAFAPAAGARTVRYGHDQGRPLVADLYQPAPHSRIAVVTVHGGSWLYNSRATLAPIAADFARRSRFVVLNIDYPLAPAGAELVTRQRAAVEQAVRWLRAHAASLGIDPRRVGGLGSSAGGNLVGLLATGGSGSLRAGARLGAAVTWSGQLDLEHLTGELANITSRYLGCGLSECPGLWQQASPIDTSTTAIRPCCSSPRVTTRRRPRSPRRWPAPCAAPASARAPSSSLARPTPSTTPPRRCPAPSPFCASTSRAADRRPATRPTVLGDVLVYMSGKGRPRPPRRG